MEQPLTTNADERAAGMLCPACDTPLRAGEPVAFCAACGTAHHQSCWQHGPGCSSYNCAPANRRELPRTPGPTGMVITAEQIQTAEPLPSTPPFRGAALAPTTETDNRPKVSGTAIAAGICAVGGIPIFGIITGAVAVILGAISIGPIRSGARRGIWLATSAMILGLADIGGWTWLLYHYLGNGSNAVLLHFNPRDFHVSEDDLRAASPAVAAALRANVLVCRPGMLDGALGSGVIISINSGSAVILTNRHVAAQESGKDGTKVSIQFVDGSQADGSVDWLAPDGVDLALVRARAAGSVTAARLATENVPHIGDDVFAIGNPQGLGWTHTKGSVSQFRERRGGEKNLRVIQTSAPINPGNSGGGLYTADGRLIGINTWAGHKRDTEGLGFAISVDSILPLLPEWALSAPRPAPARETSSEESAP